MSKYDVTISMRNLRRKLIGGSWIEPQGWDIDIFLTVFDVTMVSTSPPLRSLKLEKN